nr:CRISPR-associated protein [Acinetobacter sp.]
EVMDNNDLDKLEEKDQLEVLNQKIIELSQCIVDTKLELEQQKTHAEINYQALEKQLAEQQKSTKKLISKGFFSRLFYVVKGGR